MNRARRKITTQQITVRLDAELVARLRDEARERVVSPALLVEYALRGYLDRLPPIDALREQS